MAANRSTLVRKAALAAFTLATVYCGIECGLIHQDLVSEHMEMNPVTGWSFVAMTAGCYVSVAFVLASSYFLWHNRHRKAAGATLLAVGAFMAVMIALYYYVHATEFWLPFGVEHEPLEEAGTAAVMSEVMTIFTILAIWLVSIRPKPVGAQQLESTKTLA